MSDYVKGQWHSLNRVLNYLQTLDDKLVNKNSLFAAILDMRPEPENNNEFEGTHLANLIKTE